MPFRRGRAQFSIVSFVESSEASVPGYPLSLITGRVRDHYNVGTMTRRTAHAELAPDDALTLHPRDAAQLGIAEGDTACIESRHGRTVARVEVSERVLAGNAFLSFHFPETHANRLTGPARDPESNCPEYKLTAVRVAKA